MVSLRRTRNTPEPHAQSSTDQKEVRHTLDSLKAVSGRLEHAVSDLEKILQEKGADNARHAGNS